VLPSGTVLEAAVLFFLQVQQMEELHESHVYSLHLQNEGAHLTNSEEMDVQYKTDVLRI